VSVTIPIPRDVRKRDFVHNTLHADAPVSAKLHVANPHTSRPDAEPEWDDLTRAERDEHRAECRDLCRFCEAHRAWGDCPSCGKEQEAGDDGTCLFCGGPLLMAAPDAREERSYWAEGA
jgi:hypothetical protein